MKSSLNPMRSRRGEVGPLSLSHRGAAHHQRGLYPRWSCDCQIPPAHLRFVWSHCRLTCSHNAASASCRQQMTDFLSNLVLQIVFASREKNLNVIFSAVLTLPPTLTVFFNLEQNPALTAGEGICWRSAGQPDRKGRQEGGCKKRRKKKRKEWKWKSRRVGREAGRPPQGACLDSLVITIFNVQNHLLTSTFSTPKAY